MNLPSFKRGNPSNKKEKERNGSRIAESQSRPMRIVVFDTETTSIEKPFAYNIGYVIYDTDTNEVLVRKDFVAEQIWHNRELFTTAYYEDKRDEYIKRMRARTCRMDKLGRITQEMLRDFKMYEVECAFAYNSPFDDRVFTFNCEWFKIINPFDDIPIYDIRGYVHQYIAFDTDFQKFCDDNKRYTEGGNYSTTAETLYQYLFKCPDFVEEHTALADSNIELEILIECVRKGGEWGKAYKVYSSIPRLVDKVLEIKCVDGSTTTLPYQKITVYKEKENKTKILLKNRPIK